MAQPLIQFKNTTKKFGNNTVLDGVDLSIYKGEITSIIGKSGTGKSVLLKHVIGLLEPDSGQVLIRGQILRRDGEYRKKSFETKIQLPVSGNGPL